jgi:hypothetical protein
MMGSILPAEGEVAIFIGNQFNQLANAARQNTQSSQPVPEIRKQLAAFRAVLLAERQQLIQQELALFAIV